MKQIKIYTATKGKKEDCDLYKSINDSIEVHYEENNKESLHKVYNKFIDNARSTNVDIVVFIHDDVIINTGDFMDRVNASAQKFPVFGLAGATTCKVGTPALWHLMSKRQDQRGCVAHGQRDSYCYTSFGPLNSRVLVIDGVFIGININELPVDVRFDESYPSKFHYYDLDFSLTCNNNKVKVGVVDIPIIHASPGLTDPNDEYYKGQEYFIKKWKQ
jgi:hypothetical protein